MSKDRAKIFSSFNPLSTLERALRQKEREKCEKLELDESKVDEILKKISELKIADEVRVSYHDGFTYVKTSGLVSDVNSKDKILMIVKTKIKFDDINRIEIVKKICSIKTK
ncbi:YolD-like family protein [Campylobacter concisus]|uniref:YolD-like family protein n=1 Tax=Campylobacter concisus TaxID=199 RepID=A0A7S9WTB5_9BACT|nr:YolD-like family protein [Campylobacter concisus]QPH92513.1 YolD-like family protein [Campylobacter concisus]